MRYNHRNLGGGAGGGRQMGNIMGCTCICTQHTWIVYPKKQISPCEFDADLRLLYLVWDYYIYTPIYIYIYIVYLNKVYLNYIHNYIYIHSIANYMIIIIIILPECDFNLDSEGDHGTYGWPFRMGRSAQESEGWWMYCLVIIIVLSSIWYQHISTINSNMI